MRFNKNKELTKEGSLAFNVCLTHIKAHGNDIKKSVANLKELHDRYLEYNPNIEEFVWEEIPLFALYELENGLMSFEDYEKLKVSKHVDILISELYIICEDWYLLKS